jgi:glutaredoxin
MSATKTKVQSIIDEHPVAVFSKSYCPYCKQTKQLLSDAGAKFYAIELDQVVTYKPPPPPKKKQTKKKLLYTLLVLWCELGLMVERCDVQMTDPRSSPSSQT